MTDSFADKAVLVTGAATGIGRTTARRFAQEGARVCVADLDGDGAERTAQGIRDAGGDAFAVCADIAVAADNERMVREALQRFGGLDAAHLNAAYLGPLGDFFESDVADFDRVISVNLRGVYLGLKSAGPALRRGGAVVVTASTAGLLGWADNAAYSASKHAVIGLVRSVAKPFAARGLRVNAVCPGTVNTAMTPSSMRAGVADVEVAPEALAMPPFAGMAGTQHIAEFVMYLASSRAAFLTGGAYVADGGMTCCFGG